MSHAGKQFMGAMKTVGFGAFVGFSLTLGGCGGGDVASTPIPAPAPTPAPTPTATNASLQNLTVSQSFSNDAVLGKASYPTSGASGTVTPSTNVALTVSYNASTQTYTLSDSTHSQSFPTGGRTPAAGASPVFTQQSGTTTDTLTLFNSALSGASTTKYVQAGYWQRTAQGSSTIDGVIDAFTYGVTTTDANVPRLGQAGYDLILNGVVAVPYQQPTALNTTGTMQVNFATGAISFTGGYGSTVFGGSATLASGTNSVTGTLSTNGGSSALTGRFYGPSADEFGASFYMNPGNGSSTIGTLIGYQDASLLLAGQGLANLTAPTIFNSGYVIAPNAQSSDAGWAWLYSLLKYTPATSTYNFSATNLDNPANTGLLGVLSDFAVGPGQLEATQSDPRFSAYDVTQGTNTAKVLIYNTGTANPELALTYASFADVVTTQHDANGNATITAHEYIPFGIGTPQNQLPRTGTATYNGFMYGSGIDNQAQHPVSVNGTMSMVFDPISTSQVSLTFNPTATDLTTGNAIALNTGVTMLGLINTNSASATFSATSNTSTGGVNTVYGTFYGPSANEAAGVWSMRLENSTSGQTGLYLKAAGAFVAKKN